MKDKLLCLWYGNKEPNFLLRMLESLFCWVVDKRRIRQQSARVWQSPVPVIVVGNITVGGTGKTPLVVWLVEHLRREGFCPGVVSRGYGGKGSFPMVVDAETKASEAGDEPAMIRRRTGVPTVVDPNRVRASQYLLERFPEVDLIISDDGLQHYHLPRNVEIAVLDGSRLFGNGHCLPAGPLREPISRLQSVDFTVVNGCPERAVESSVQMTLDVKGLCALDGGSVDPKSIDVSRLTAFAGIGNPDRFFKTLSEISLAPSSVKYFPDHHQYVPQDLPSMPWVTTEKDCVKLVDAGVERGYFLSIEARLPDDFVAALLEKIQS